MTKSILVLVLALFVGVAGAQEPLPVAATDLPAEARVVLQRIEAGTAMPYRRDGVVFGNYEHRLPSRPRGYYREYTVPTPGTPGRGARRIVSGAAGERYYSPDHYRSFRRIAL